MTTPVISTNPSRRKRWLKEGLLQGLHKGFWPMYMGNDSNSLIHVVKRPSADAGHIVTIDGFGKLTDPSIKGEEQAEGKGELRRRFNTSIGMVMRRDVVKNGSKFAAIDTGDLHLTQHSQALSMLADKIARGKDQFIFDLFQASCYNAQDEETKAPIVPSHKLTVGTGKDFTDFNYNTLMDISSILKTGITDKTGYPLRNPISPTRTESGEPVWFLFVDNLIMTKLRKDTRFQDLVVQALPRSTGGKFFKGYSGRVGNILLIEAPTFMGKNESASFTYGDTQVENAGMRVQDDNGNWAGTPSYNKANITKTTCFVAGSNSLFWAIGKNPEYHHQLKDFGRDSESAVEYWDNGKRVRYNKFEDDADYVQGINGYDWGTFPVEIDH